MTTDQHYSNENVKAENFKVNEDKTPYGFFYKSPHDKLLEDVNRSGLEKLQLFTQMLRRGKMLDKAIALANRKI
jgi:hypothetical protein